MKAALLGALLMLQSVLVASQGCTAGKYLNWQQFPLQCNVCPPGDYCVGGYANPTPCPSGTYNPNTASSNLSACISCPPGTFSPSGEVACSGCPAGMYESTGSTCAPCPAGTNSSLQNATSATVCKPCSAGYFSSSGSATCSECPAGTFNAMTGQKSCSQCPPGTSSSIRKAVLSSVCIPCVVGTYADSAGSSSCTKCPAGTYNPKTSSSNASNCLLCPAGSYNPLSGMNSSSACLLCPMGTYGAATGLKVCTSCPAGYYSNLNGSSVSSSCLPCSVGTFSSTGSASCRPCPAGSYSNSTATATCTLCPAGYASSVIGSTSASTCTPCPAGSYSLAGGSSCLPCPVGTYSNITRSGNCIFCPAGTFNNQTGRLDITSCRNCSAGSYSSAGSGSCTLCSAGTYGPTGGSSSCSLCRGGYYSTAVGSTSQSSCIACGVGSYSTNGSSKCLPCQAGYFTSVIATPACTPCPGGTSCSVSGSNSSSDCVPCPAGYYSNPGSTSCTKCPAGSYANTSGSATCTLCSAGYYNPSTGSNSSSACIMCPVGKFSSVPGSRVCTSCYPGSYNPSNGSTACTLCPAGYSNPNSGSTSSSSCFSCSPGTYSSLLNGSASCTLCSPGSFCDTTGCANCTLCRAGYYNPIRGSNSSTSCVLCSAGSYSSVNGSASCSLCPAGTYSSSSGSTTCTPCPPGTSNPLTGQNLSTSCKLCRAGYFGANSSSGSCTSCPAGSFSALVGATNCTVCLAGYYSPQPAWNSSCLPCPGGRYNTNNGSSACTLCPAGQYSLQAAASTGCQPCPPGRYGASSGLANVSACSNCPAGSFNPLNGSSSAAACTLCPRSSFAESSGSASCTACPGGAITLNPGSKLSSDCISPLICSLANVTFRSSPPLYPFSALCTSIDLTNVTILDNAVVNLTVAAMTAGKQALGTFQMTLTVSNCLVANGGSLVIEGSLGSGAAIGNISSLSVLVTNLRSIDGGLLIRGSFPARTIIVVSSLDALVNSTAAPTFGNVSFPVTHFKCLALVDLALTISSSLLINESRLTSFIGPTVLIYVGSSLGVTHQSSIAVQNSSLKCRAPIAIGIAVLSSFVLADYSTIVLRQLQCTSLYPTGCLNFQNSPITVSRSSGFYVIASNITEFFLMTSSIVLNSYSVFHMVNTTVTSSRTTPFALVGGSNVSLSNASTFVLSDSVFVRIATNQTSLPEMSISFVAINCSDSLSWFGILRNAFVYLPIDQRPFTAIVVAGVFVSGYVSIAGNNCTSGTAGSYNTNISVWNGSVSLSSATAAFVEKCNFANGIVSHAGFPLPAVTSLAPTACGACDAAVDCFKTLTNVASSCQDVPVVGGNATPVGCSCLVGGGGQRCLPATTVQPAHPRTNTSSLTESRSHSRLHSLSLANSLSSTILASPNRTRSNSTNETASLAIGDYGQHSHSATAARQGYGAGTRSRSPSQRRVLETQPVVKSRSVSSLFSIQISSSSSLLWHTSKTVVITLERARRSRSLTVLIPPPPPPLPTVVSASVSGLASASVVAGVATATVAGPDSASDMQAIVLVALAQCAVGSAGSSGQYLLVTPFALSDSAIGALCGNLVAFAALAFVQTVCVAVISIARKQSVRAAAAKSRFPGFSILLMASMHQSTLFASLRLMTGHDGAGHVLLGILGLLLSIAVPCVAGAACLKYSRRFVEYGYPADSAYVKPWTRIVRPVGVTRPSHVGRYLSSLVTRYCLPSVGFVLLPFASSLTVNLVAILPETSPLWLCKVTIFLSAAAHLGSAAVIVIFRPHRVALNGIVSALGLVVTAILHAQIGSDVRTGIEHTISVQAGLSLLRSVFSVAAMLLEWRVSADKSVDKKHVLWIVGDGGGDDPKEDFPTGATVSKKMPPVMCGDQFDESIFLDMPLLRKGATDPEEEMHAVDFSPATAIPTAEHPEIRPLERPISVGKVSSSFRSAAVIEEEAVPPPLLQIAEKRRNIFGEEAMSLPKGSESGSSPDDDLFGEGSAKAMTNPLEDVDSLYREIDEAARQNAL